MSIPTIDAFL
jgi:14-3-3 protein epsilon